MGGAVARLPWIEHGHGLHQCHATSENTVVAVDASLSSPNTTGSTRLREVADKSTAGGARFGAFIQPLALP